MKTIKYIIIIFAVIFGISACELPDNVDPKNATVVPISTIYTSAQVEFANIVDDVNVNLNIFRLLMQYWQETTYFDEAPNFFHEATSPPYIKSAFPQLPSPVSSVFRSLVSLLIRSA